MERDTLLSLVQPEKFQSEHPEVFPSMPSMLYFIRAHKPELIERGAILAPVGRMLINPPKFAPAVLEIGKRVAAERTYVRREK